MNRGFVAVEVGVERLFLCFAALSILYLLVLFSFVHVSYPVLLESLFVLS